MDTLQAFHDIVKEVIKEEADSLREEIKRSIDPITTVLDECKVKIREHEDELNNQDARLLEMETRYAALSSKYDKLQEKQSNPTRFIAGLLHEVLGGPNGLEKPPTLDRAHRAVCKPTEGGRPRPFIICVHYYHEKEQIQRLAREKGRLEYRGKQIFIFPDYSADLNKRCAAFNEVKKMFREKGVRYRLFYPAKLQVSFNGETKMFDSPTAAKDFYSSKFGDVE
uniref:L1 transposable element RRM domain-containing protein n=1 Tax=Cyprinus carpio TaxID=7962 RepID=A0A8C2ETJ3_CYPCA